MTFATVTCSIVIPTHNRPALLKRAVSAALLACTEDGEVLVIDDQSTLAASVVLADINDPRLQVRRTSGPNGAAAARNAGVGHAKGDVIFFLDDDDELLPDYCKRVLAGGALAASHGFASTLERHGDEGAGAFERQHSKRRLRTGLLPRSHPLRDHIAALSEGFWIRRHLFTQLGGFCTAQTVDEDTDLCVRLYTANLAPWYETAPGTRVYKSYSPAVEAAAQLTRSTPRGVQLQAYRRTFERNGHDLPSYSEARWFLCKRYLRLAARQGWKQEVRTFLSGLAPWPFRTLAWLYFGVKAALNTLRSKR